ncbi:MAG: hypothetical protein GWN85_43600, partial [Gemmatimonadetes bacterium]|nr:hypothetical protein [Gemmatimonadota bacterium]NIS37301.1 hypothetical protein [Actinomycetota bacterium]NIU71742.1 hypothetical protein [Actinomycetota bacterium]NIW33691.1 hypothetical protein [Actinomycetota bacterium]NIX25782.1 hypothetical protein [Actinomycetota bacterium]
VRIVLGRPASTVVEAGCVPIQGTSDRLAAGRLELERCSSGAREPVREDFGVVGYGRRHADRTCGDEGVEVSILAWSCNG